MSTCIRSESVIERGSLVLEGAAEQADEFMDAVVTELERVGMDETSRWTRVLAWLEPSRRVHAREFVVVTHRGFPDLRHWIGCRPVGIHLEVLTMTAIAPPWPKRRLVSLLCGGEWWRWSLPRGLAQEEEVRTWLTLLHEITSGSAKGLVRRLAGGDAILAPAARDVLAEW
jgi:hypothetical protein